MSVVRHTAYNFAGAVVPLIVSLITVPLYLTIIGLDRYGVLAICWLLVGYFNLFDFGLGRATAQKLAALAHGSAEDRSRIFWTSVAISGALACIAAILFVPLATVGLSLMKLQDAAIRGEISAALPLLVAAVPFGIAQSLLTGSLEGRREFLKLNIIQSLGTIATAVFPLLVAVLAGPRLSHLLGAALVARSLVLISSLAVCSRAIPILRPRRASRAELWHLLRFGGWTTVTSVVGPLLAFVDRFAIGAVLSSAAVALYVVPFNFVSQLVVLPGALAMAIFPRLAAAAPAEAKALGRDSVRVLAFVVTPMTLLLAVGVGPFLELWIGPSRAAQSIPVAYILLFGFWANSCARIPFVSLQASARPDLIAKTHLGEILPYLVLLYVAMRAFGLPGAALAWSVRCAADALILHLLNRLDRPTLRLLLAYGALVLTGVVVVYFTPFGSASRWLMMAGLAALTATLLLRNVPPQVVEAVRRVAPFIASQKKTTL